MKRRSSDVLIIGGGLTGLTLAYLLKKKNIKATILEARKRLGGRIYTAYEEGMASQEMGATWLSKGHVVLGNLLAELGLTTFEQLLGKHAVYEPISTSDYQLVTLPPNNDPSFRIKGGTSRVIQVLEEHLDAEQFLMGQVVESIEQKENGLCVKTNEQEINAAFVVSTLPPYLFSKTVNVSPSLPNSLLTIAENTHTWMGESIKVGLRYKEPFWRDLGKSGTIFSNVGPVPEMYDHSNAEDTYFSLKGFLNGGYFSATKEERLALILKQLEKYFGSVVRDFIRYEEVVWRNEPFTFAAYKDYLLPHRNNGHGVYQRTYLDGQLLLAGAETAAQYPGYMEGAVRSAYFAKQQIEHFFKIHS